MATMTVGAASLQAMGGFGLHAPARPGGTRQGGAPMRRGSVEAGTFEEAFFTAPASCETDAILRAARKALDAGRRLRREARVAGRALASAEKSLVALTASAVRVLEELLTLARLNRGRVFPTYDHLAEATGLGRVTVARGLTILDRLGFLARQRRFKRVASEGPGPRYAQTSNVYRLLLPAAILPYLPRRLRPAPLPVDEVQRQAERVVEQRIMLAALDCRDLAQAQVGDGPLGRMLARLGAAIDRREREFQNDPQPLPDSYETGFAKTVTPGHRQPDAGSLWRNR